ncbi:hypothetical protein S7711_10371 [Stachybotrys chartarum IBT 7711]|uniref:Uncharacterized protein n=1 Tax=Stachybotrys chartarum (strain CBS 109288 / IBT 7711) TaxID=1280523 RepID=A0A084ATN2_STACB|nr:hypothetical protein S7711_10371 [Stachybotrys chartarum IBT 7711]KFA49769.1 hypothetical protein S40293_10492 [Stachybotrys chartarum IBT 40293]KFA79314.1 hypothetical protein S40288_10802 [Stachybotrys chartarum IBT 40288]
MSLATESAEVSGSAALESTRSMGQEGQREAFQRHTAAIGCLAGASLDSRGSSSGGQAKDPSYLATGPLGTITGRPESTKVVPRLPSLTSPARLLPPALKRPPLFATPLKSTILDLKIPGRQWQHLPLPQGRSVTLRLSLATTPFAMVL